MYHTVFTIIETDAETYCIPYSSNDEFLGLTSKTLYVFDDMMQILIKRFDESKLFENPDSNGGVPLRREEKPWVIPTVLVISAAVIVVSTVLLVRLNKKRKIK